MGNRDLPDIYAHALGPAALGLGHIYQANPSCPCYNLYIYIFIFVIHAVHQAKQRMSVNNKNIIYSYECTCMAYCPKDSTNQCFLCDQYKQWFQAILINSPIKA